MSYWIINVVNSAGFRPFDGLTRHHSMNAAKLAVSTFYGKPTAVDRKSEDWVILRYRGFDIHLDQLVCDLMGRVNPCN
jgi:hypothetical protein